MVPAAQLRTTTLGLTLAFFLGGSHLASAQRYELIDLGLLPGGAESHGEDVNDLGQVVGFASDEFGFNRPYLWDDGVMIDLGTLGGPEGRAYGLTDNGFISGSSTDANGNLRATLWDGLNIIDLGVLSGTESTGRKVDDTGMVVGVSTSEFGPIHAFMSDGSVQTDLGSFGGRFSLSWGRDLNNFGQVVGSSQIHIAGPSHAFLWENGVMTDLGTLGGTSSQAHGINERGDIVGFAYLANEQQRASLWRDGDLVNLGSFGGSESSARDINESGQIVGYSFPRRELHHGFLFENDVMYDLNSLCDMPESWRIYSGRAINDAGQIAATMIDEAGFFRAVRLDPADDPFTLESDELVGGEEATISVSGARPNDDIWLLYSVDGPGWFYHPRINVAITLEQPARAADPTTTDGDGEASWTVTVPNVSPRPIWLQAVQDGIVSNVVATEIQ